MPKGRLLGVVEGEVLAKMEGEVLAMVEGEVLAMVASVLEGLENAQRKIDRPRKELEHPEELEALLRLHHLETREIEEQRREVEDLDEALEETLPLLE